MNNESKTDWNKKLHEVYWNNPAIPEDTTSGQLEAIKLLIKDIAKESFEAGYIEGMGRREKEIILMMLEAEREGWPLGRFITAFSSLVKDNK